MNKTDNSYPVESGETQNPAVNTSSRFNVLNIGQLLFLAFLFVMLLVQSINIYTNNSAGTANRGGNTSAAGDDININFSRNPADTDTVSDSGTDLSDSGVIFVLGEYEGKLAILSPDKKTVYESFDVYISTLPAYDKELLTEGIKIRTNEELRSLLEDYSS